MRNSYLNDIDRQVEDIITHQFLLQEGAKGYEMFDGKLDNCIKTALLTS